MFTQNVNVQFLEFEIVILSWSLQPTQLIIGSAKKNTTFLEATRPSYLPLLGSIRGGHIQNIDESSFWSKKDVNNPSPWSPEFQPRQGDFPRMGSQNGIPHLCYPRKCANNTTQSTQLGPSFLPPTQKHKHWRLQKLWIAGMRVFWWKHIFKFKIRSFRIVNFSKDGSIDSVLLVLELCKPQPRSPCSSSWSWAQHHLYFGEHLSMFFLITFEQEVWMAHNQRLAFKKFQTNIPSSSIFQYSTFRETHGGD